MRHVKHMWKVAAAGALLTAIFVLNATTHRTTQAAAPPVARVATASPVLETKPIFAVDSMGGGSLSSASKTDW